MSKKMDDGSLRTHRNKALVDFRNGLLRLVDTQKLTTEQLRIINLYEELVAIAVNVDLAAEDEFGGATISSLFMAYSVSGDEAEAQKWLEMRRIDSLIARLNRESTVIKHLLQKHDIDSNC